MVARRLKTRVHALLTLLRRVFLDRIPGRGEKGAWVGQDFNLFLTDPNDQDPQ